MKPFVIGSRGSDLALAQLDLVEKALLEVDSDLLVERKIIKTVGDQKPDVPLLDFQKGENPIVDKGIFTKDLETALANNEIDCAVHSAKDVPTQLEDSFSLESFLPRAAVEDVLLTKEKANGFDELSKGAVVGTSSVRRIKQISHNFPNIKATNIRGNVPTRVHKLCDEKNGLDGIVLAKAGLDRLGKDPSSGVVSFDDSKVYATVLDSEVFLPACGQGAVGIQIRANDTRSKKIVNSINDPNTKLTVNVERFLLHKLEAGCHTPVGALVNIVNGEVFVTIEVFDEIEDDKLPIRVSGVSKIGNEKELIESLVRKIKNDE